MARLTTGDVRIPNLENIETNDIVRPSSSSLGAEQYAANSYGTVSLSLIVGVIASDEVAEPGQLYTLDDITLYCDDESPRCQYVFIEENPENDLNGTTILPIMAATDRSVTVVSECRAYRVVAGGNGTSSTVTIDLDTDIGADPSTSSNRQDITIPVQAGPEQSTFLTNTRPSASCGPACAYITVLEISDADATPWLYNCTTRIGRVENARVSEHELGANLTRIAAAAIALQGYASAVSGRADEDLWVQAQVYPSATTWGSPWNGSALGMAQTMSRFAAGVIAVVAQGNSKVTVPGRTPHIGVVLDMEHWAAVHAILVTTAAGLLVLGIAALWVAHRVVVPAAGPMAEAMVLKAMVPPDELGGELRDGDTGKRGDTSGVGRKILWRYREEYVGDGVYDLFMEETEVATSTRPRKSALSWVRPRFRRIGKKGTGRAEEKDNGSEHRARE